MSEHAELRLALVCYGGVSLAVYMHGVTKELHKLVQASRAFDALSRDPSATNPFGSDSEKVYFDVLAQLAQAGRPISVAVDIVGGTSAGGINGVVLAKAIALNACQDKLREMWIDEAQISKLLDAPSLFGWKTQAALATMHQLVERGLLHLNRPMSLLKSNVMAQLLLGALGDLDTNRTTDPPTLIPAGGSLELFVTTTDQDGYDVTVATGCGGRSQRDRGYAQVMQFSAGSSAGPDGFGAAATYALAFAARATSAFPVAFAPVSIGSFATELSDRPTHDDTDEPSGPDSPGGHDPGNRSANDVSPSIFRFNYAENNCRAGDADFVDGGLMDNAPFDLVIDAIAHKSAEREVIRRLIYIEPDPVRRLDDDREPAGQHKHRRPSPLDIKDPLTAHPFLNELIKLRDMNSRIEMVGAISERQMAEITAQIKAQQNSGVRQNPSGTRTPTGSTIDLSAARTLANQAQRGAQDDVRPTWNTYQRMKATSVAARIAAAINRVTKMPPESSTATFVSNVLAEWVRRQDFWMIGDPDERINDDNPLDPKHLDGATYRNEQCIADFLQPRDTPYRERRLLFILQGINQLFGKSDGPSAESLAILKKQAWELLTATQTAPEKIISEMSADAAFLAPDVLHSNIFDDPAQFVVEHADDLGTLFAEYARLVHDQLGDGSTQLWTAFAAALDAASDDGQPWSDADRTAVFARYLAFPRWDALVYPIISLSQLPQFTPIPVSQFSPIAATALDFDDEDSDENRQPKLYGKSWHHFGAFIDPAFRENDYLWGRLDAAELIVRMLGETAAPGAFDLGTTLQDAFTEIYDLELPDLTHLPQNERNSTLPQRIRTVTDRLRSD